VTGSAKTIRILLIDTSLSASANVYQTLLGVPGAFAVGSRPQRNEKRARAAAARA